MRIVKADIYWNLHKHVFSIRVKGKVIAHSHTVDVLFPNFVVSKRGRERVIAEKRKNVHAFVRGFVDLDRVSNTLFDYDVNSSDVVRVTYNPYKYSDFVNLITEKPIKSAYACRCIKFDKSARIFAIE